MNSAKLIIILFVSGLVLSCASCNKTETSPPADPSNVVIITHDLNEPSTWSGDSVYVIEATNFYVNNTLTIQPGAVIKFHPTKGPDLTLGGTGTILAVGTSSKPIIFTSFKDDDNGGDTNGDGNATVPERRDWGEINTNGLNGSKFEYCHFLYGGRSYSSSTLTIVGTAIIKNCVFAHNNGNDNTGWFGALGMRDVEPGSIVQNNVFYDNIRPLNINTYLDMDDSNIFHNPEDTTQTNKYNGICVCTWDINWTVSWNETEVPYVIDDKDWRIESVGSLTLGNNVVLKFRPECKLTLAYGAQLNNHDGSDVYFTSYKDDSKKGDTNGDGNISSPGNGDWEGIYDENTGTYMSWSNILYDNH